MRGVNLVLTLYTRKLTLNAHTHFSTIAKDSMDWTGARNNREWNIENKQGLKKKHLNLLTKMSTKHSHFGSRIITHPRASTNCKEGVQ